MLQILSVATSQCNFVQKQIPHIFYAFHNFGNKIQKHFSEQGHMFKYIARKKT